ncbi:MAG TPA: pyridoxamine 5'-phosphate oxidase family protein [Candidatus Acidoferrales bacterium]|nr:pyridoxamine 5'-phosphate oxidase family protein [Candidatus Acidoferrales bacterium]
MIKITPEMKERIDRAFYDKRTCLWATSSKAGAPDISFRGSTFVYDEEHLAFWDRSRGVSTTNIEENPQVCMMYFEPGRGGWRFYGRATIFKEGEMRQKIMDRVIKEELDKDPERKGYGVLVRVDKIRRHSGDEIVQERGPA